MEKHQIVMPLFCLESPELAIITGVTISIGKNHLDFFVTVEKYFK